MFTFNPTFDQDLYTVIASICGLCIMVRFYHGPLIFPQLTCGVILDPKSNPVLIFQILKATPINCGPSWKWNNRVNLFSMNSLNVSRPKEMPHPTGKGPIVCLNCKQILHMTFQRLQFHLILTILSERTTLFCQKKKFIQSQRLELFWCTHIYSYVKNIRMFIFTLAWSWLRNKWISKHCGKNRIITAMIFCLWWLF